MDTRDQAKRRGVAVTLMRRAAALLDEEHDGYVLMRLQHAIDEAESKSLDATLDEISLGEDRSA